MPPSQEQQKSVPVIGSNVSAPSVILQPPFPIWKRAFAFLGYIAVYYFVSETIFTLLVLGTTVAIYFYGLDVTFPSWIFTAEKVGAAILGILAAWVVGRYFHWTVFRKIPREKKPHGWFVRSAFYGTSGIIVLLFILLTAPSVMGLFFKDIPPIDDSDLSLPTISLPDSQNAYPDLMAAGNAIDDSYNTQQLIDAVNGGTWDAQFANQAVASNTQALALFASTTQKSAFQDPTAANPNTVSVNTILPPLSSWRILVRLNGLAALNLAHTGNSAKGLQTALIGVSTAQKIEDSQAFLIDWLVAVSMKEQVLQTIQNIIASTTVSTADLKSFAATLQPYADDASGLVKADKVDYYEQKSTVEQIAHGDTADTGTAGSLLSVSSKIDRTNFYYFPNQSISYVANDMRQKITDAQSPCDNLVSSEPTRVAPSNLWLLYVTPNAIGKVIHDIVAASGDSAKLKSCQENTLLSATQILAAVKAYSQDKKKLPDTLDELVPTYLSAMPLDPFSGQEFKYDPTKMIIYSVGQDKKDVGGSTSGTWDTMENPTFSVAF